MDPLSCSFCQHANPADAKFCNECGGALKLKPCAFCEAVDDVHAARCHACGASFGEAGSEANGDAGGAGMHADGAPSSSVVRALETIEADLASLSLAEARGDDAAPPLPTAPPNGHHSVTLRGRVLRPLLVATLVLCAIAFVFYGDRTPLPAPTQKDATIAATDGASAVAPPTIRAGTARRTVSGPIEQATAAEPMAPARLDTPITATKPSARRAAPPALQDVAAPKYPVPPSRCTDSVEALGLCIREGVIHGQ